jgi:RNA polymerase sigma-B factor
LSSQPVPRWLVLFRQTRHRCRHLVLEDLVGEAFAGSASGMAPPLADKGDSELFELLRTSPEKSSCRDAVREVLVRRYESLVRGCVRRYRESPEPVEDLMQAGYLGLVKAINNFDPQLGTGLRAYAEPCISGEIKKHFRDKRWQVHVQRPTQELMLTVRHARAALTQRLGRMPAASEIAREMGLSTEDVGEAEGAEMAFRPRSLDAPVAVGDEDAESLGELMGQEDPGIEHALDMEAVWAHFPELPRRQQRILVMRFYGNLTQQEIGERLGISQMHVSRLLANSLSYLRVRLQESGVE